MRLIGLAVVLTLSFLLAPLTTGAQQAAKVYRVGVLVQGTPATASGMIDFRQSLHDLGYVEGRNLLFDLRLVERQEALPDAAAELVRLRVDVIVAATTLPALAAKRATSTILIVMAAAGDPVHAGLVTSLARPGANITGNVALTAELIGKQLELLKETLPRLSRVAILSNGANPLYTRITRETEIAATTLGIRVEFVDLRSSDQVEDALATVEKHRVDALLLMPDPVILPRLTQIADFAVKNRLPTISLVREFPNRGSLMSYGPSLSDLVRRSAAHVDKILKGAKPADLPVEQPIKFELVINLKTAKALGLTIPPSVLGRADQVIE
jgi:putative tryptophan/tyrosine transport system substrate-binding protein